MRSERPLGTIKPALIVYCFARATAGDSAGSRYLRALWDGCRALGMTEPLPGLRVGVDFPALPSGSEAFALLAAARRPRVAGAVYSAFLFAEHDVIGLVAALAPNRAGDDVGAWTALRDEWLSAVNTADVPDGMRDRFGLPYPPGDVLGEVFLFEGLYPGRLRVTAERACATVQGRLPGAGNGTWWQGFDRTADGFMVWEAPGPARPAARRTLCVLARADAEDELDQWGWATGGFSGLMPFTRYMLHAAKIGYEARVHARLHPVADVISESDALIAAVLGDVATTGTAGQPVLGRLLDARERLDRARVAPAGLVWTVTRLQQLHRTVEIAERNLLRYKPAAVRRGAGDLLSDRDLGVARLLLQQVDNDLAYLQATRERAEAARALAAGAVDKGIVEHRERLTLIQASVIGGLLMALTASQAFGYKVPAAAVLQLPVIALLTAAAFALPVVVLRWSGTISRGTPYLWADPAAGAVFGSALGWFLATVLFTEIADRAAPMPVTLGCVVFGAALAGWANWRAGSGRHQFRGRRGRTGPRASA